MSADNDNKQDSAVKAAQRAAKLAIAALFIAVLAAAMSLAALMKPFYG